MILTFTLYPVSYLNSGGGVSNIQLGRGRKRHIHKGLVMGDDVKRKREERNLHTYKKRRYERVREAKRWKGGLIVCIL